MNGFKSYGRLLVILLGLLIIPTSLPAENTSQPMVLKLTINGAIGPATASYIKDGIEYAQTNGFTAALICMDTPGGLDKSMRTIVQSISNSTIPIITYVSPIGARAASAGTYILYASHIAAMSPGTNLGAATPVNIMSTPQSGKKNENAPTQSAMQKKVINDATAYIESLADLHNRNKEWAIVAVTEGKSLPADEALEKNVIDMIAEDESQLLERCNGRLVKVGTDTQSLELTNATLIVFPESQKNKFLKILSSPDIAYMLLLAGIYGLFFEFSNPGMIVPGTLGAICLFLALYSFQMLPLNLAGLGLIGLGLGLLATEAFLPSFGILGIGGILAFTLGSFMLFEPSQLGGGVSWPLILSFSAVNLLFFLVVIRIVFRSFKQPLASGSKTMIGKTGTALKTFKTSGQIKINGEIWKAQTSSPVQKDDLVTIIEQKGLILTIELKTKKGEETV